MRCAMEVQGPQNINLKNVLIIYTGSFQSLRNYRHFISSYYMKMFIFIIFIFLLVKQGLMLLSRMFPREKFSRGEKGISFPLHISLHELQILLAHNFLNINQVCICIRIFHCLIYELFIYWSLCQVADIYISITERETIFINECVCYVRKLYIGIEFDIYMFQNL